MIKKHLSDVWKSFKIISLLYLLVSSAAWFGMVLPQNYVPMIVSFLMIGLVAMGNFKMQFTQRSYALLFMLFVFTAYSTMTMNIQQGVLVFLSLFPAVIIYSLDKPHQNDLLNFLTGYLGIMLMCSLGYFILSFVIPLPHTAFKVPTNDWYLPFDNYFLFLRATMYTSETAGNVTRFSAFFIEPGHLSMICCLILFANRYQFRKYPILWVYLACVFLSFSLVGYVILILSLAMLKIRNVISMIASVIVVAGAWLFCTEIWNGGDNPVNILIFERLKFDEEKGISGNNRTVRQTDIFFRRCLKDGTAMVGVGSNEKMGKKIMGAGYKIYILRYGIWAVIIMALFYLMLINPRANKRYAFSFFTVITLLFMQRAYPLWFSWLATYTLGIGVMRNEPFFTPYQIEKHRLKLLKKEARKKKKLPVVRNPIPTE